LGLAKTFGQAAEPRPARQSCLQFFRWRGLPVMENRAAYGNFTGADTLATTPPTAGCPARSLAVVAARRYQIGRLSVRCRPIGRLQTGRATCRERECQDV